MLGGWGERVRKRGMERGGGGWEKGGEDMMAVVQGGGEGGSAEGGRRERKEGQWEEVGKGSWARKYGRVNLSKPCGNFWQWLC